MDGAGRGGWDANVPCTCTHVGCYMQWIGRGEVGGMLTFLALAHMLDATQWIGRGGPGGMLTFLALAHTVDATQWMGWDVNVLCACTHVACYAMDGMRRGQVSTYRTKNNKCRLFPPALPLHT